MFRQTGKWVMKTAGIWFALIAGTIIGGMLGAGSAAPPSADGPLSPGSAFLIVTGLQALMLGALAAHARVQGWKLALLLFAAHYGTQTVMTQIETVYFADFVKVPMEIIPRILLMTGITAACGAIAAAFLFRPSGMDAEKIDGLAWRIPLLGVIYVAVYFCAGFFIAWQAPALRTYYAEGAGISLPPLIALQLVRGAMWAFLGVLIVRHLTGGTAVRATLLASAFSIFAAAQLLYPNPYMPWAVRLPHLIEVGISNALFGAFCAALLLHGRRRRA